MKTSSNKLQIKALIYKRFRKLLFCTCFLIYHIISVVFIIFVSYLFLVFDYFSYLCTQFRT